MFQGNKDLKEVIATSDGQCFTSEDNAHTHASRGVGDSHIEVVSRAEAEAWQIEQEVTEETKQTAEQRIEAIEAADTVEAVQELLKGEKAVTVKAAGENRIKELESKD